MISTSSAFNFAGSDTRVGWTLGVGVEYASAGPLSVKAEYDYLDFGRHTVTLFDPTFGSPSVSVRQQINEIRLGINYRFFDGGVPVVAKY